MKNIHLTDFELQQAAQDVDLVGADKKRHISQCASCNVAVDNYRAIATSLGDMPFPAFDETFAANVIAALPVKKVPYRWVPPVAACIGLLLIAFALALYGKQVTNLFSSVSSSILYLAVIPAIVLLVVQLVATCNSYQRKMDRIINFK